MTDPLVIYEMTDHVALITLNRPKAMNAMSRDLREQLVQALDRAGDENARVIVLTGAGDRAFCAGLDLNELSAHPEMLGKIGDPTGKMNPVAAIKRRTCPVIAAVNGVVVTGGLELMLGCDMAIASETARFGDTHAGVGVLPGWGMSQKLSRIIGPGRAREMHFSGRLIDAATAERWGLVNRLVPGGALLKDVMDLAREIAGYAPDHMARIVSLVREGWEMPLGEALEYELRLSQEDYKTARPANLVDKSN